MIDPTQQARDGCFVDLDALLDQDRQGLLEKEAHLFDEMTGGGVGPIVLFGPYTDDLLSLLFGKAL